MCSLLFTPFLSYLVLIQTQNFMLNQTTNTRFAKRTKVNTTEAEIAARLEHFDSSDVEDDDFSGTYTRAHGGTNRSSIHSRMTSLDSHQNLGCGGNCRSMFCGPGHF